MKFFKEPEFLKKNKFLNENPKTANAIYLLFGMIVGATIVYSFLTIFPEYKRSNINKTQTSIQ